MQNLSSNISDYSTTAQPTPHTNNYPAIWQLVIHDMNERDKVGISRYGTALQPFNGRDALTDVYQEILDAAVYIRQVLFERDGK